jgi:endoglucanase
MSSTPYNARTRRLAVVAALAVPGALLAAAGPSSSVAAAAPQSVASVTAVHARATVQPASTNNPGNPLAGRAWGVYKGRTDQAWQPYADSTGTTRTLLGKIALRPRATWFGAWTADADISAKVKKYIANMSGGDTHKLVQMTVFRMKPWEHNACKRLPTAAEQHSYKLWINRFAAAIGSQHAAVILQPDGPFVFCVPGGSKLPSHLIGYAARKLSQQPNTSVYIDAGASDWPSKNVKKAADILMPASIQYVRGFALNSTHYVSTASDIEFGSKIVYELKHRGVPGKHFVINTAQNGAPFTWGQKRTSNFDNSPVCTTTIKTRCVTLGIPPTTDVDNSRWNLSALNELRASRHVDGYLWYGRPWLYMQSDPFSKTRALWLARTTPY